MGKNNDEIKIQRKDIKQYAENFINENFSTDQQETIAIHAIKGSIKSLENALCRYDEEKFSLSLQSLVVIILDETIYEINEMMKNFFQKNIEYRLQSTKKRLNVKRFRRRPFQHYTDLDEYLPTYSYDPKGDTRQNYFTEKLMLEYLSEKDLERIQLLIEEGDFPTINLSLKERFEYILNDILTELCLVPQNITTSDCRRIFQFKARETLLKHSSLNLDTQNFYHMVENKTMYLKPLTIKGLECDKLPFDLRQGFKAEIQQFCFDYYDLFKLKNDSSFSLWGESVLFNKDTVEIYNNRDFFKFKPIAEFQYIVIENKK